MERTVRDDLLPFAPPPAGCPPAYGGCTCSCHHSPGVVHCVPCCRPTCATCDDTGVVNTFEPTEQAKAIGRIETGDMENWPGPCPDCTPPAPKVCANCNNDRWIECDGSHGMPPGVGYPCADCNPGGKLPYKDP